MKARELAERLLRDPEAHVVIGVGVDSRDNPGYREVVGLVDGQAMDETDPDVPPQARPPEPQEGLTPVVVLQTARN